MEIVIFALKPVGIELMKLFIMTRSFPNANANPVDGVIGNVHNLSISLANKIRNIVFSKKMCHQNKSNKSVPNCSMNIEKSVFFFRIKLIEENLCRMRRL